MLDTHLAYADLFVRSEAEGIVDEGRHRRSSDPEEHVLSVFNQVQAVAVKALAREVHGWREKDAVVADHTALPTEKMIGIIQLVLQLARQVSEHTPPSACCAGRKV